LVNASELLCQDQQTNLAGDNAEQNDRKKEDGREPLYYAEEYGVTMAFSNFTFSYIRNRRISSLNGVPSAVFLNRLNRINVVARHFAIRLQYIFCPSTPQGGITLCAAMAYFTNWYNL